MFDLFRSRDRAVRYLLGALLGLVALSLVVTLIPGYGTPSGAPEQIIAKIGDQDITYTQVQATLQNVLRNRKIPSEMVQFYVPQVIDQMITERALAYQAERMGFQVTDEDVARAIRSMLTNVFPNGEFDRNVYTRFLAQQGMTVPEFERNVRTNLLLLKLQNLALEGIIVTPGEVEQEFRRRNDKVKLDYVAYTPGDARSQVSVTPEEVQSYYNAHKTLYTIPEKRSFHLLVADENKIAETVQVSDADLQAAYNRNLDRFRTPERIKARHILISTTGKSPEDVKKAEEKARDLLKQIKGGADFAALAKQHSDDPGSKGTGGDLGWVQRGQMVPAFETATFNLKPGEISDVIKTDYGYHVIQALEKEQARVRPFEEVKQELAAEAKKQIVYDRMQDALEQARAELARNPQQAQQIASKYNLVYHKVENVAGGESVPEVGTNPELEANVTSLKAGETSPVLQVGPTKLAVASVTNIQPSRPAELDEVRDKVRDSLIGQKAQQLSDQRVKEATTKLKAAGQDLKAAAKAVNSSIKSTQFFTSEGAADGIGPATYVMQAFEKPVGSVLDPITIGSQVFLVKVAEKQPADTSQLASNREQLVLALKQKKAAERKELFEDGLLARLIQEGKVRKYEENIQRLVRNYQG
jgi:peptidyl-prolyl cis-trans isomerase D